jgi:choline dehydrogenase-like flavoprotein
MTAPERRLAGLLRALAFLFLLAAVLIALGPFPTHLEQFFREPPFVAGSVAMAALLGLAMLYAAGDVRRRADLVGGVVAALAVTVAATGSMLLFADTGNTVDVWVGHTRITTILWVSLAVDGLIAAALLAFLIPALRARRAPGGGAAEPPRVSGLSGAERFLRGLLVGFGGLAGAAAILLESGPFLGSTEDFARQLPFVAGSIGAAFTVAMLSTYAATDPRRSMALVAPVIATGLLAALAQAVYLAALDTDYTLPLLGGDLRMTTAIWATMLASLIGALALLVAYRAAWKGRYGLDFMWPAPYRALAAIADVLLIESERGLSPEAVAQRVEGFLVGFRAHRRWLYRVALTYMQASPLIELWPRPRINPPLSELDRETRRRVLTDHFQRLPNQGSLRLIKHVKQIVIRISQQLTYAGYYGAPASFESIGYQPFSQRRRYAKLKVVEPGFHPLAVERPGDVDADELEADICIVGSGAAGSILAYELAKRGRDVLILERGEYVEPREFTEDEVEMVGRLYADGLMQQTEDWRFTILQGSCVGGSTTVNNAVCFPPPDRVLARWNDPDHDAGLDTERLHSSVHAVQRFLHVERQTDTPIQRFLRPKRQTNTPLNPSARKYVEGARKLGVSPGELDVNVVRANIKGCYGSGYCNIGCRWGKKLSMLETALPWAQRDFPGRVRIVAECEVDRVRGNGGAPRRVAGLEAKLGGRPITIRANRYVLSAGAVASSYLMIKSRVGRDLPVGRGFSANMGAPLTAEFDGQPLNAYDGLQISHYGVPSEAGFVFETWFNPPVSQALNLPGWFERHFRNMRRYDHLMAVGVLVGTASCGHIRKAKTGGPGVVFTPTDEDLQTLARGLRLLGRILLKAGARRVMVNTWGNDEYREADQLSDLDRICADPDYITLGTGHPQGGNAISRNPERGVVGPDFKVHGYDNLYVCDASVFPTSLTVNPQLTVMSLAHYAAPLIAGGAQGA